MAMRLQHRHARDRHQVVDGEHAEIAVVVVEHDGDTRARVDEWLGSSATLMKAARIVPAQKDGVTQGFKLYAIRRASPLHALGFKNGDLVTEIGGRALTSATSAMEADRCVEYLFHCREEV